MDPDDLNSYRSISNLSFISKMIKRVVAVRFNEHCDAHKLLPVCQSAYSACHSTETAVTIVHNNIVWNIDQKDCDSILVLLDLSAAFDKVDHVLLFADLEAFWHSWYGLDMVPLVSDRTHSDISSWAGKVNHFRRELQCAPRFSAGPTEFYCLHSGRSVGD